MGLFDFFKKKNTGIEDAVFNEQQFQNEVCAVALWKLEAHHGNPDTAVKELKKIGLNEEQIELILEKVAQFTKREKQNNLNPGGIEESKFSSDDFQKKILDSSFDTYFKHNHQYEAVEQELLKAGLNNSQADQIISKLKIRISDMVDDFQEELDSGRITEIKIKPNTEHVKGNVDSEQIDKYIAYGAYQMNRGDFDNALELFDKAIELDENATLAFANKGTLYTKKGDHEKALSYYNKALAIEPDHIQILENKMELLFETMNEDNEQEFIDTAKAILQIDPVHPNALVYIIQRYLKEQDLENALKYVKKLFANFHTEGIAIQLLLETFHKLPEDRAINEFRDFNKEIKEKAQYQLEYCKGLYLMGNKEYEESIATFEHLNKLQAFSWNYYQMAIIKHFQNKTDECLDLLAVTFEMEPALKEDAKQISYFKNLSTNIKFVKLTS